MIVDKYREFSRYVFQITVYANAGVAYSPFTMALTLRRC
jgi:hypothetical protein